MNKGDFIINTCRFIYLIGNKKAHTLVGYDCQGLLLTLEFAVFYLSFFAFVVQQLSKPIE